MRIVRGLALIASGCVSLLFVVLAAPLVVAMRADRRERGIAELARDRWPVLLEDDDDPGVDVDGDDEHCWRCSGTTDDSRYCRECGR